MRVGCHLMGLVSLQEQLRTQTYPEGPCEGKERAQLSVNQDREEVDETSLADTLVLDCLPPESCENKLLLFKQPSV